MARAMLRSSFNVMIVAVIFMRGDYQNPPAPNGASDRQSRKIANAI
jgi:hypothetical protein